MKEPSVDEETFLLTMIVIVSMSVAFVIDIFVR